MSIQMLGTVVSQLSRDFAQRWGRKLGIGQQAMPWMRQKEFKIFQEVILRHQPVRCLEWGAGYSTLYFPTLLSGKAQWHAVEHDVGWADRIATLNRKSSVTIHRVPPDDLQWQGDGTAQEFEQYLKLPIALSPFDLIIIDGRARRACLDVASSLLSEQGVVILHDANRAAYHSGFNQYRYRKLFQDYRSNYGGVWIGSNKVALETILDIKKYEALWSSYKKLVEWWH